jgi:hypothetical protein
MSVWHRVFAAKEEAPTPAELSNWIKNLNPSALAAFHGDDLGWFRAELRNCDPGAAIEIERYVTREDGIRPELNTWAGWLESLGDKGPGVTLMPEIIAAQQLFTVRRAQEDSAGKDDALVQICQWLAGFTAGVYQVDGRGFFSTEGELLVAEQ